MKVLITTAAAVMMSVQPLLVESVQARTVPSSQPATTAVPTAPKKHHRAAAVPVVAGTDNAVIGSTAISGGEIGLFVAGGLFVAVAAGAGGGSSHKGSNDCHCGGGGGTTGTTGTTP
jgi:hypothetical protein